MKKIVLVLLIIFMSCANSSESECSTCYVAQDGLSLLSVQGKNISFKYWLENEDQSKKENNYVIYISRVSPKTVGQILNDVFEDEQEIMNKDLASITFFTGQDLQKEDSIGIKNVVGIQLHRNKGSDFITEVYNVKEGRISKIEELTSKLPYHTTNDIYSCSQIFGLTKINSILIINDEFRFQEKGEKSFFKSRLEEYKKKRIVPI